MKKYARKCDKCGKLFNEGFCIDGGLGYYCSEKCLKADYTKEEIKDLDLGGDYSESYRTAWEDNEDMLYYEDGTPIED